MSLLTVRGVCHQYGQGGDHQQVLTDIDLCLAPGETVALLGRSGCGKSTLARLLAGLETPYRGEISWREQHLRHLKRQQKRQFAREVQMVFQDAPSAVNPRRTLAEIIDEPLRHLTDLTRQQRREKVREMMAAVALEADLLDRYPAQLSGGQLQRVCIARALVVDPRLVILDEAVSSLDLVLQADIIELLKGLRQRFDVAWLFITHDLRLVDRFCQRVVVMDAGKIVEDLPVNDGLAFSSLAGQALQQAVLPPYPVRSRTIAEASRCNV